MKDSDYDAEKHSAEKIDIASSDRDTLKGNENAYTREELVDPSEETLHRGLSARQISMIAVRTVPSLGTTQGY